MSDIVYDPNQSRETAGLLITQFSTQPNMVALAQIFGAKIQEVEDALFQLFELRGVSTAFGAQLDILGSIVGVLRAGLNDTDYATAIRAEILLNTDSATVQQILSLMYAAFPNHTFTMIEEYPATFTILAHEVLDNPIQAGQLVQSAKPAGVAAYLVYSIVPLDNTFTYTDSNLTQPVINYLLGYGSSIAIQLWTPVPTILINTAAMLYASGIAVAIGDAGTIITSIDNGTTWTQQSSPILADTASTGSPLIYGNGLFVFGDSDGNITVSNDGVNWSTVDTTAMGGLGVQALSQYAGGLFIACGSAGTIATSPDGVTWTPQTSGVSAGLTSVYASPGLFLIGATDVTDVILSSPDGVTWTPRTLPGFNSGDIIRGIVSGAGVYVAFGEEGSIASSTDGHTWTARTSGFGTDIINTGTFAGGQFVIAGGSGKIATSPDGITWTLRTSHATSLLYSIDYDGATYAVGGDDDLVTSPDGVTWTAVLSGFASSPAGGVRTITHTSSVFLASGISNNISNSNLITAGGHYAGSA